MFYDLDSSAHESIPINQNKQINAKDYNKFILNNQTLIDSFKNVPEIKRKYLNYEQLNKLFIGSIMK